MEFACGFASLIPHEARRETVGRSHSGTASPAAG
jgi:hypothetical protein